MLNKQNVENYKFEHARRGSGEIGTSYDYLQSSSPALYYYEKLKSQNNPYLRPDMWSEAARKGETNILISNLMKTEGAKEIDNKYLDQWESWSQYNNNDYDSYMLALSIPNLDNTTKVERTTTLDDGSEYSFGSYTDQEWAIKIFDEQVARWEAVKIEEDKKNRTFWEQLGDFLGTVFIDIPLRVLGGVADFLGDIYNVVEGTLNMAINWSGDTDVGQRFLYAFQNEDGTELAGEWFRYHAYQWELEHTSFVNAIDAYEQGYRPGEGTGFFGASSSAENVGAGMSKFGEIWGAATQSIGYMLPSMIIPVPGTSAAVKTVDGFLAGSKVARTLGITAKSLIRQGVFYTGIFSSNISSTLDLAKYNGISYKDLNAGEVVGNAALKAAGQLAVEWVLAGILGTTKLDRWAGLATKSSKGISKATSELAAAGQWLLRTGKDAVKEGLEELLQDTSDGLIDLMFGANGNKLFYDQGMTTLNLSNLIDSFIVGAVTSFAMGAVSDVKYFGKRAYGVTKEGKPYKLGAFQTMNYVDALRKMQEWNSLVQDPKINKDIKADAAFKLSVAYDTLSQLFTTMGTERVIKANQLLITQAAVAETKKSAIMKMAEPKYAQTLMDDFMAAEAKASAKYVSDKLAAKVQKAAERKAKGLKEGLVTKFMNIITKRTKAGDPDIPLETNVKTTVINSLDKLGVEAIVGVDGNIITRSEDIIFVNNQILAEGDIRGILEGISYESVLEVVKTQLNQAQKNMIVKQYSKIVGTDGTLDDAITALLFDKQFYCQILLLSGERGYKLDAIKMLATIDKIIANKLAPDIAKGTITEGAYLKLMERVQNNMRAGLINFATTHCKLDLGEISNEVLSAELKEEIRNHQNVQYTEFIDKHKNTNDPLTEKEINRFIMALNNISTRLSADDRQELISAVKSKDIARKRDAFWTLSLLSRNVHATGDSKLVYLPTTTDNELVGSAINNVTTYIGLDWYKLINGEIDATKFTKEFNDYLKAIGGIDWTDKAVRLRLLDQLLFDKSGNTLTIDNNGNIMQVIDKDTFCKDKYTAANSIKNLRKDVVEGKVKTIQDISKLKLDKSIGQIEIKFDSSINDARGYYNQDTKTIYFTSRCKTIDTIMHEITHVTQNLYGDITEASEGGTLVMFETLPKTVQNSIKDWLKQNCPIYYKYASQARENISIPESIYFTLDGEIKARATANTFMHDSGFLYSDNYTMLMSPDRKVKWPLKVSAKKRAIAAITNFIKTRQSKIDTTSKNIQTIEENISRVKEELKTLTDKNEIDARTKELNKWEQILTNLKAEKTTLSKELGQTDKEAGPSGIVQDLPITKKGEDELKQPDIQFYMKNAYLKNKAGLPIVWYRGSNFGEYSTLSKRDNARRLGEFYTKDYNEATLYGITRGYITDLTKDELFIINANGQDFNTVIQQLTPKEKELGQKLQNKYRKFVKALEGRVDITIDEADSIIRKELGDEARSWDIAISKAIERYNLTRDEAIKFIIGTEYWRDGKIGSIESILPIAIIRGKSAVLIRNVKDGSENIVDELVMLKPNRQKRVTFSQDDINWDKAVGEGKQARFISNKVARESNLKYWIKKGIPIQLDPDVANFVISTTSDFNKLPRILRDKILAGKLNKFDIIDYVTTAANMNDYVYKAIAKYIFKNTEAAKITFKDMLKLFDNIESLAALAYVVEDANVKHTPTELEKISKDNMENMKNNQTLAQKYVSAINKAQTVKLGKNHFVEAHADTKQLNSAFFRYYNGSFASLRNINNIGKYITAMQQEQQLIIDTDEDADGLKASTKQWNWVEKMRKAEIDYEIDDVAKTLDDVDYYDKVTTVKNYISQLMAERVQKLTPEQQEAIRKNPNFLLEKLNKQFELIDNLSEADLNKRYLAAIGAESMSANQRGIEGQIKPGTTQIEEPSTKNRKDRLRATGKKITQRIAGLKRRYNSLSELTKKYINPKTYKLTSDYRTLSDEELDKLNIAFSEDAKRLKENITKSDVLKEARLKTIERLEKMARKTIASNGKVIEPKVETKKTIREKIQIQYKTVIKQQTFDFIAPIQANTTVEQILNTQFSKTAMSQVKGLSNNTEENVASGKEFFEKNAGVFMNATISDIEQATIWFLDTKMNNVTSEEFKKFQAVKMFFLSYVYSQAKQGGVYEGLNNNIKQRIENALKADVTAAGTTLSAWNQMLDQVNPLRSFVAGDIELDGIKLTESEKTKLFEAIMSNDVTKIREAQQEIYKSISEKSPKGQSIFRRILSLRSMSMLSSPLTWLRNKVSNMSLKRIYKMSDAIGRRLFTGKHVEGQLKLDKQITPEIQAFINEHFIDNKLFDSFVGQLSRYNPSDIADRKTATGQQTKEQIMAKLVLKAMYSEYYNNEMFKSPFMKQLHEKLMKMLSDNNYVRESAVKTFGKIIAEKGYDLSKNQVTDAIMNDFSVAIGMAMSEYMHSDNFFNQAEKWIAERTELGHFVYKLILPYASSSWNWFKAMIKLSPLGLARSIVKMTRLEKNVAKQQALFLSGKSQVSGELAEYMIRRDLGQGVIGTIAWGVGMLLASLGFMKLEDDDYGTPKLRIGNISVDISSIFGSSSILAGAALITQIQKNGLTLDGFISGLDAMTDVWINDLPIMDIVQMDMYSDGGFTMGMDQLESIALSFIPNILGWLAGATYTGTLRKKTFLDKAMAKIPFLANLVEKKVDPYTGEKGSWRDIINRIVPYISIEAASQAEINSKQLGLNKSELKGTYKIEGEDFNVKGKDLTIINEAYGKWNAEDLTKFYDNKMAVKVKVGKGYKTLKYNQMTDEQRKNAVQSIMENNAELAKILAWVSAGNKYYASASIYSKLRQSGYTSNIYRGTKGFVKK